MPSNFEPIWADINRTLHQGISVQNWSIAKGYTGGSFNVVDVDRTSITVFGGKMRVPRRISRGHFEKIYGIWEMYLSGKYRRSEMGNVSQNTTYILSILHAVRNEQGRNS